MLPAPEKVLRHVHLALALSDPLPHYSQALLNAVQFPLYFGVSGRLLQFVLFDLIPQTLEGREDGVLQVQVLRLDILSQ